VKLLLHLILVINITFKDH